MEEFVNELFKNNFLIAIQVNNTEEELKSHLYGFKRKDYSIYADRVSAFPDYNAKNGTNFLKYVRKIYNYKPFYSVSVAVVSKELYCRIFDMGEDDYRSFIKNNSHEVCVEEEFGWFTYGPHYKPFCLFYRIPKELVIGSLIYDENSDTFSFVNNSNYYMNLSEEDREAFINTYKELIINEVENDDYDVEYPYQNIMELRKKL